VHADVSYLTLKEELEFVKNYLDLEKFRFENKFDYIIDIGDSINLEVNIPKMIIQTFVENAVKHGLVPKPGKGILTVRIREENDYLYITIDDNGIGRHEALKINAGSTGKGIEIMNEFITLSNSYNEQKISFEIHDIPGDMKSVAGTHVSIKLPVNFTYNSIIKTL
jgi:sensor histidine kinase YesM